MWSQAQVLQITIKNGKKIHNMVLNLYSLKTVKKKKKKQPKEMDHE